MTEAELSDLEQKERDWLAADKVESYRTFAFAATLRAVYAEALVQAGHRLVVEVRTLRKDLDRALLSAEGGSAVTRTGTPLKPVDGEWAAPCGCRFYYWDGQPHLLTRAGGGYEAGQPALHWHPCEEHKVKRAGLLL